MDSLPSRMKKFGIKKEDQLVLQEELNFEISRIDYRKSFSPEVTRNIIEKLKHFSPISDPYEVEKKESNLMLLSRYPEFQKLVKESPNQFDTALRLAIAGNIIDFGPAHRFNIDETIKRVLKSEFAIDHSGQLKKAIKKAETILYLGDNCGEIVLDKLFLETINHQNVWFAVRDKVVLNDITMKEALEVGIDEFATLISNGDDSPSTLLHRVSKEFLKIYKSADLIIAKGMGNFEGLMHEKNPRLFNLMMIKCEHIGQVVGANYGDFVVKQNHL
ncbi:MAG: DUF89 family protein [Prolixibacteraceae bacterium]|nr:DUF89 family protein [Prolixibacteraceae bacterium]MBN2775319.1 DUF89 family protein [Prolixibacteraceae bacterium]